MDEDIDHLVGTKRNPLREKVKLVPKRFMRNKLAEPEIDFEYGRDDNIDPSEARAVRELHAQGLIIEELQLHFGFSEEVIEKMLEGDIWPYAGGPLRRLKGYGPHLANNQSVNQQTFLIGVFSIASKVMSGEGYATFCELNGITLARGLKTAKRRELNSGQNKAVRFRDVLRLHAEGVELETAANPSRWGRDPRTSSRSRPARRGIKGSVWPVERDDEDAL